MKNTKRILPLEGKQKRLSKKERAKNILMNRKKRGILRADLDDALTVTNSPELISQLKKEGMPIDMIRVPKKTDSGWQGKYIYNPPKKVSKIQSRAYLNNF